MSRTNRRARNTRIDLNQAHREECEAARSILNDEMILRGKKEPGIIYPTFLVDSGLFISRGVFQSLRPDIAANLPAEQASFVETMLGGEEVRFHITKKSDRDDLYSLCLFGVLDSRVHTFYEPQHIAGQGEEHDATYNLHYLGGPGLLAFFPLKLESAKYVAGVTLAYWMLTKLGFDLKPRMSVQVLETCHDMYPENKHLAAMPGLLDAHEGDFVNAAYDFAGEASGLIRQGFEDMIISANVAVNIRTSFYADRVDADEEPTPILLETEIMKPNTTKTETTTTTPAAPVVDLTATIEKALSASSEKAVEVAAEVVTVEEGTTLLPADYPSMEEQLSEYRHTMGLDGNASQAKDEPVGAIMGVIQQGIDKATDYMPSRNVMLGVAGAVVGLALYKSWAR